LTKAAEIATNAVTEFLRVETVFDGLLKDEVVRELTKANKANLATVIELNQAHQQLPMREKFISALLRRVDNLATRFGSARLPAEFVAVLSKLTALKDKTYGELKLAASDIILRSKVPPFEERKEELRKSLISSSVKLPQLAKSAGISSGVDLLCSLFSDPDPAVRKASVEVYVRRVYRAYRILSLTVTELDDGRLQCTWEFQPSDSKQDKQYVRQGMLSVVKSLSDVDKVLTDIEKPFDLTKPVATDGGEFLNTLHIALLDTKNNDKADIQASLEKHDRKLAMLGIRLVNVMIPVAEQDPLYYSFPHCDGYKEDILRRNMRPTLYSLLELGRLKKNYELERLEAVGKNAQVYIGTEKVVKPVRGGAPQALYVRGISHTPGLVSIRGAQRALAQGLDELERAQSNPKVKADISSRIFLHSLPELEDVTVEDVAKRFQEIMGIVKSRLAQRLLKLSVDEIEVIVRVATTDSDGNSYVQPVRLVSTSMGGEWLKCTAYLDTPNPVTGVTEQYCSIGDENEVCVLDPYAISNAVQTKRAIARRVGSTYAYDFLGLLEVGLVGEWEEHLRSLGESTDVIPPNLFSAQELVLDSNGELSMGSRREVGTNKVGMVAWLVSMKSPEYTEGRDVVFIANDVTVQSGSFGVEEDDFYFKASEYARQHKIPRVYIACNSGARIGLVDELKPLINIKWTDAANPTKGFQYIYLTDEDYKGLPAGAVIAHKVPEGWAIDDIIGTKTGIGVENLRGSGMIAGETSRAYDEIFTLSYVTGRSVGIGAYLVRLGQRVIQMQQGPMILTGFSALNKLLGRDVYVSQDQLGGPQIMVPNGVTHEEVPDDQAGVASILKWLSFVPKAVGELPASRPSSDPVSRDVVWRPTKTPYDPRLMLSGTNDMPGFFDKGTFKEYLAGWGKSVVIGRGRLGGIPMGAIAVETRLVDKVVPADPADPNSREAILPQAGQVLFPDSSYKVAQAIRDFDKEGLPLMMFANWRGFSGGSRDMAGEILKFGAMIVDALREYSNPVFVYLPPHGELRGGSWVVVDPTINEEKMSMYADPLSRGGILEPAGIIEVKFRKPDIMKVMHRTDEELRLLDSEIEACDFDADIPKLKEQIKAREDLLYPVYSQIATEFADAHDKTGRMKAKGVIKDAVEWSRSREFFYYTTKRRIMQDDLVKKMKAANPALDNNAALDMLKSLCPTDWEDNKATIEFFSSQADALAEKMTAMKKASVQSRIEALKAELEAM